MVDEGPAEQLRPDPPLAMFHIDRFEPLRPPASRITFRKLAVEPVYSTRTALPEASEDRIADPFEWDLIAGLLASPVEEVEEVAFEPDPPMAPAWDPPIPFAESPLHVPKVVGNEADVFPGLVVRPVMPAVVMPIRPPQPYTAKVASPVPDTGLGVVRKAVLLERPAAWCIANGLAQPSILREWQSWRPVFDPVRAPQLAMHTAPSNNGAGSKPALDPQSDHNAPRINEISEVPAAMVPVEIPVARPVTAPPPRHHEVVINLAALGLLDDPN